MRKGRHASTRGQPRGQIKEAVSIRERPPEAEDRAIPGHWEGDLLAGSRNTHVATLVEGSSRFVMLVRVGGKDSESVVCALSEQIRACADRSWSAVRSALPSVAHPALSAHPPHDDHHIRERHPEVDRPPYPLRTPHQLLVGVVPRVGPLRHPTLPGL